MVATVRSEEKGKQIRASHADFSTEKLEYVVVPDIAAPGAFSKMEVKGLEAVVHVASPVRLRHATNARLLTHGYCSSITTRLT